MSVEATPAQQDMDTVEPTKIKIETDSAKVVEVPMTSKLAHVLAIVVAAVIAVAVSTVLADGTSVIKLKDPTNLPIATNPELKSLGLSYRLDQLLGPTYGVGLQHDQSGHTWYDVEAGSTLKELISDLGVPVVIAAVPYVISTDDLKHPVPFLSCDALQMAGLCAMYFGYIAETVAVVMVIFHALALTGALPPKIAKVLASLIWFVLATGFLIVVMLAAGIYSATWECDQPVIPSIRLADHFNYNYGFPYAIVGFISALLIFLTTITFTSTKDGKEAYAPSVIKGATTVLGGLVLGVVVLAGLAFLVFGANDAFSPAAAADPDVNPCQSTKPYSAGPGDKYFKNTDCFEEGVAQTLEQAGANVTKGYKGLIDASSRTPITSSYSEAGLCPVNVHWHLGAEHLSVGQFDEDGTGPSDSWGHRQLADSTSSVRLGYQCHHYDASDSKFTTEYDWQTCTHMKVGQTYEIHWPHSAAGACGTDWQYQTPFYDGVFCNAAAITIAPLNTYKKIGVQSQVFTIVNDESYYYGNLIDGMIVDETSNKGTDMAIYTGSTTGTSRDNEVCSRFTPITWQVDRTCHLISASSFDKLCADMGKMNDDMSPDFHAHGSRTLSADELVANNQQSRKK